MLNFHLQYQESISENIVAERHNGDAGREDDGITHPTIDRTTLAGPS